MAAHRRDPAAHLPRQPACCATVAQQQPSRQRRSTIAYYFVVINVFLLIFNLLPIPPLDGWRVLLGLVDARTAWQLRQFEQYAAIIRSCS